MKKTIQTLIFIFLLISTNVYCEYPNSETNVSDSLPKKMENTGIFEVGIGIEELEIAKYKVNYIYSFPINSKLSWGIGTGIHIYNPNYILIPLYANFKANLYADRTTPYFSVNTGCYLLGSDHHRGILFNPTVGMSFKKSNGRSIEIGINYDICFTDGIDFSPFNDLLIDMVDNGLVSINFGISF